MSNHYVYLHPEPSLWTVGFYDPKGTWQPESDHESKEAAARRVAELNGGRLPVTIPWLPIETAPINRRVLAFTDEIDVSEELLYWLVTLQEDGRWRMDDGKFTDSDFNFTHWAPLTPPFGWSV